MVPVEILLKSLALSCIGEEAPTDGDWSTLFFLPGWFKVCSRLNKRTFCQEFITLGATSACTATGLHLPF